MMVLITGSSKGIGASTAIMFAEHGYDIVITYNTDYKNAYELGERIKNKYKVNVLVLQCDISNEDDINNLVNSIKNRNYNVDVLVNNAALSIDDDIIYKTKKDFMKVLEVNVVGTFLITREIINNFNLTTIINVSSTDSIDTYSRLNIDYSVSKAGINLMTKMLSDIYDNIKICAILPNWVDTESVRSMDKIYLNSELLRIGQSKLIDSTYVAKCIYNIVVDDSIKTGSMIRIDG